MSDEKASAEGANTISEFDLESLSLSLASIVQSIVREHMESMQREMEEQKAHMLQSLQAANMQMMPQMPMGMPQMPMGMPPMWPGMQPMGMGMGMPQPMGMPQMPGYGPGWAGHPGEGYDGGANPYGQPTPYGQSASYDPMRNTMQAMQKQAEIVALLKKFTEPGDVLAKAGKDRLKSVLDEYIAGLEKLSETGRETMAAMHTENVKTQEAIAGMQTEMHGASMRAAKARHELQVQTAAATYKTTAEGIAAQQKSFHDSNELIRKALKGDLY